MTIPRSHDPTPSTTPDPTTAVRAVRSTIVDAAGRAGRDPDEVRLVAIGKTHAPAVLAGVVAAGVVDLGENRVAELTAKFEAVDLAPVRWHFVGQLQSRKARELVGHDVLVHSVDRRSLVDELDRRAGRGDVVQRILVQVNVGDDPAKGGCGLHEVDELVAYAVERPNLEVQGLMTVPPLAPPDVDPARAAAPHFATLRDVRDRTVLDHPGVRELSMGMSADLSAAVAEGATMVRVGTGLFGPRGDRPWTGPRRD